MTAGSAAAGPGYVTVLPGDGIGPEVVEQALLVLDELSLEQRLDVLEHVNASTWLRAGTALTDADLAHVRGGRGVLLGAVGDPRVESPAYARSVLLRLRGELDLYANIRPVQLLADHLSPLREGPHRAVDCVVVRENTEGLYAGVGGSLRPATDAEVAVDAELTTRLGVSRILDVALGLVRRGICMVDKSNAVPHGGAVWQRCWRELVARHPDLPTSHLYVDAAAAALVQDPARFDVIVTSNSYGDILSDLTAALGGGLGGAASANLDPATGFGLFEPVHGSAPDLAGTGTANPAGAVLSAALLVEQLGRPDLAGAVRRAVRRAVGARRCTPDMGGTLTTKEAGAAIRAELG